MKYISGLLLGAAVLGSTLPGCKPATHHEQADILDLSGQDTSVPASKNFFDYANGTWIKNTQIPASKTGWGSFYVVRDQALSHMKTILDSCMEVKDAEKGSVTQQIGDLYAAALDSATTERVGISGLQSELDRIHAIRTPGDVVQVIATHYLNGDAALFSFYVAPDDKNSNVERAHFDQGGLGLPNRDYYFKEDSISRHIRDAYHQYVTTILSLTGDSASAAEDATALIALETHLAKSSKPPVALRDPQANYHLLSVSDVAKLAPRLHWKELLRSLKAGVDTLQVGQPEFYQAVSSALGNTPVAVWRNYLTFHLVNGYASWLSKPFADASFNFYNKLLNGQQQPEVRWKRAAQLVDNMLGDALGQLYVKRFFPPQAKAYMLKLVDNLQETYRQRIQENTWMTDSTKVKAIDKLNAFVKKIGYPDHWKDYSSIDVDRTSLVADLQRISQWEYEYEINKLGKPVDKTEWQMTPPTVNAYYNPPFNEIVFPAGILQPPFYFQGGDDAVNYGGIGVVIGHEMTHGFDDQGSQYDKNGNLVNWWTKEDRAKFEKLADQVVAQYNAYTLFDSVHVNGKLTEGENIADIGGVAIAYAAFKKTPQGQGNEKIDGLTPDQRFFMGFAQIWRMKTRPQRMLWRINNDPHSPEMFRVNGPVSNMPAFYEAYDVKPGDKMYRPDSIRVHIW
jgi:putative endopeptidase